MVEPCIPSNVVEQGFRTGARVFDMKGHLNIRQAIDLSALKQLIWDNHDECDKGVDGSKSY